MINDLGIVILAAGESSRLGRPKQLLEDKGELLLRKVIRQAESTKLPVITVLGAYYEIIKAKIYTQTVFNSEWKLGMGTSVKAGLNYISSQFSDLEAVLFLVADQPLLSSTILHALVTEFRNGNQLVACNYNGINGVPALFGKQYFTELLGLPDNSGAQLLLRKYSDECVLVKFEEGMLDIDTEKDWLNYLNS